MVMLWELCFSADESWGGVNRELRRAPLFRPGERRRGTSGSNLGKHRGLSAEAVTQVNSVVGTPLRDLIKILAGA
jgi:hypothetical protein